MPLTASQNLIEKDRQKGHGEGKDIPELSSQLITSKALLLILIQAWDLVVADSFSFFLKSANLRSRFPWEQNEKSELNQVILNYRYQGLCALGRNSISLLTHVKITQICLLDKQWPVIDVLPYLKLFVRVPVFGSTGSCVHLKLMSCLQCFALQINYSISLLTLDAS